MDSIRHFFEDIFYAIKYIIKRDKIYVFILFLDAIVVSFSSIFSIYSLKLFLDLIVQKNVYDLIKFGFIIFGISLGLDCVHTLIDKKWIELHKIGIAKTINFEVYDAVLDKNIIVYDKKEYYDQVYLNLTQGINSLLTIFDLLTTLITQILSIVGMGIYISYYSYEMMLIAFFIVLISVGLNFYQSKLDFNKTKNSISNLKVQEYVTRILYLKQYAKEVRMFKIIDVLKHKYSHATSTLYSVQKEYANKSVCVHFLQSLLEMILQFIIIVILFMKFILNEIILSDFLVLYNGMMDFCLYIETIFNVIPSLYRYTLYIREFKKMVKIRNEDFEQKIGNRFFGKMSLEQVGFSYENKTVIKEFSYEFRNGCSYGIVGENGSGKSTLLNLICGLLLPKKGKICLDGKEVNEKELKSISNVMFQDSQLYALPIIYNILMRPIVDEDKDEDKVNQFLEELGMLEKIQKLPFGIYTPCYQELDEIGTSFSGGEAQKILIARALANVNKINIFDEVTNGIDVDSKENVMNVIKKYTKDTLSIFVSHEPIKVDQIIHIKRSED